MNGSESLEDLTERAERGNIDDRQKESLYEIARSSDESLQRRRQALEGIYHSSLERLVDLARMNITSVEDQKIREEATEMLSDRYQ